MAARTAPVEIEADAGAASAIVPRLIDQRTVAQLLHVTQRTVQRLVREGAFPAPLMLGHNTPRWRASDYNAYVARLREAQAAGDKRRRRDVG
jgi:predicted DNA-binding transcriptional regulator AlpA